MLPITYANPVYDNCLIRYVKVIARGSAVIFFIAGALTIPITAWVSLHTLLISLITLIVLHHPLIITLVITIYDDPMPGECDVG